MPAVWILALSITELSSIVLVAFLLFLGFKLMESSWSYRISKPNLWDEAVSQGRVTRRLRSMERFYRDKVRFYNFWFQVERLRKENIPGAFAELGVYQGETARLLHEMDSSRKFYLLDTFKGFSEKDTPHESKTRETWKSVDFSDADEAAVLGKVGGNENVKIIAGFFPDTAAQLPEEKYALVHLDADLYQPTLAGLKYFYSRISPGGVIIVHDYNHNWDGIKKAVDEFSLTIPESISEVTDWQGSVMIIKNIR